MQIISAPMEERFIEVKRTAAYTVLGDLEGASKSLTLACHGYGQLASYMASKFKALSKEGHAIVSAEGLNKFYWKGVTGDPVATWMTSKNRLQEIKDFTAYLDQLHSRYLNTSKSKKKVLLGFSQGGTTLWRWIHQSKPDFDVFINWAGWIPEDIDLKSLGPYLANKKLIYVYGKEDQYLSEERLALGMQIINKNELDIERITFEGPHRIDTLELEKIYARYIQ